MDGGGHGLTKVGGRSARVATTQDEIQSCFNAIAASKTIVYDTETSGLDWQKNYIVGHVFSVGPRPDESWYLPVRHRDGGNIEGGPCGQTDSDLWGHVHWVDRRIAAEVAARQDLHVVGFALKFDLHMAANHGIWWEGTVEDCKANAALIDETQGDFSMETCARIMGVEDKKVSVYEYIKNYLQPRGETVPDGQKSMSHFWKLPGDGGAADYAAGDGTTNWQLWQRQLQVLEEQELLRVWAVEKRVTKTLFRMERRGVPVDENRLEKVAKKLQKYLDDAKKALPAGLNVRSAPQLALLFQEHNLEFPITGKGNPSFTEDFLEDVPVIGPQIVALRKFSNLSNTFVEGSIRGHLYKGRVHTTFNQIKMEDFGTVSGRLSSSDPNMQQVPKTNKILAPMLRQLYRPKKGKWRTADYRQQEYRVFAEFAGAQIVLDAYKNNPETDYHQFVADLLGVPRDPDAKRINLGVIYNMGVAKLALKLGVPVSVAQDHINTMRRLMPEAKNFNKDAERVAKRHGFVFTKLGRRRRFPDTRFAHKAGNAIIQGSSADMTKLKMAEIDEYLLSEGAESGLILQVHDSLEFEEMPGEEHLMKECIRIMESFGPNDAIQFEVPMVCDVAVGASWGHATYPKYTEWV